MNFVLLPNWKQVLLGSWASRLGFLVSVLGFLDLFLPAFQNVIQPGTFALVTACLSALIPVVRVFYQKALHDEPADAAEATTEKTGA